jgi:hypothetical protein
LGGLRKVFCVKWIGKQELRVGGVPVSKPQMYVTRDLGETDDE